MESSGLQSLDRMFRDQNNRPVENPPRRRGRAAAALLSVAVITGLGVGAVAAPGAVATSAVADRGISIWDQLPTDVPVEQALPQHTVLLDSEGVEFARLYSENRIDVPLEKVSPWFTDALISTEDRRFYEHNGVDTVGTARALVNNVAGGSTQGASTITQQLVQNIMIFNAETDEQKMVAEGTSYEAKLRETKYAIALEEQYEKDQILSMYANAVYFGNNSYGVQAASIRYFDKDAADLQPHEAALLVGMLKNPTGYDPFVNPDAARERRDVVLMLMNANGELTDEQYQQAIAQDLSLNRGDTPSGCDDSDFPYYCALVRDEILTNPAYGKDAEERADVLARGGMRITTGLDRQAIEAAQKAVDDSLGRANRVKAGVAMVEPGTGIVRAVAQNSDWDQVENIYAKRPFQSGSAFKPIVTAAGLEEGIPANTRMNTDGPYRPAGMDSPTRGFNNYGNYNYGVVDGLQALTKSVNVYFVRLAERVGVRDIASLAHRLGLRTVPQDLTGREASIVLGSYEVTPLAMAGAYASFAADGIHCEPVAAIKVVDSVTGQELPAPDPDCVQVLAEPVADTMAAMLAGPLTGEGGTLRAVGPLADGRAAGAKTGTTNGSAANWTVGITGQLSSAVWIGDPRGGFRYPLDRVQANGRTYYWVTGAEVAGPIWKRSLEGALAGREKIALPTKIDNSATRYDSSRRAPDVRGLPLPAALSAVKESGLTPVLSDETRPGVVGTARGSVTDQSPAPSSKMNPGSDLTLHLQDGSDTNVEVDDDSQ